MRTGKCLVRWRTDRTAVFVEATSTAGTAWVAAPQVILPAAISPARMQAEIPPVSVGSSGGSFSQAAILYGQRGAKRQPSGAEARLGGRPSMVSSLVPRGRSRRGTE